MASYNINGGSNNNAFGGSQYNNLGRDQPINSGSGTMTINNYGGVDDQDNKVEGDEPLSPEKLQKELETFKQLYPKLKDDELKKLDNKVAQAYLDRWQKIIISDLPGKIINRENKDNLLHVMARLARVSGLSPKCLRLVQDVKVKYNPVEKSTDTVEVYKGKVGTLDVIVKALKKSGPEEMQLKRLSKLAITWQRVQHDNILPFLGLYYFDEARSRICVVYKWMEQQSLDSEDAVRAFEKPSGDGVDKVAKGLLDGVKYMHGMRVVHGDLKRSNFFIDPPKVIRIADLGLAQVLGSGDKTVGNIEEDKYQCARLVYQKLYRGLGGQPSRPVGIPDGIWANVEEWLKKTPSPGGKR